ncbi:site-specific DNA-methyltransferase [Volucribacter amazonae]|uniref:site-specific DNA-methyltransferase (adenine-specific) n=1 Tax=Volucribacter amazonae TaxID=256731 RepID=A0A9X4PD26_9PAST|nr:site-specific DNA-methyltransferase [Volucribacter amazonae]MDG6895161.1 hypothetical protein [Volucribacter amazonae]
MGEFLRRELDFYIKNEVMHLENIQHADGFKQIESSLRQIQVLRTIALELIDFLAQLENFQKKLWLKKKFIASCHYLVTLDRLPEELLPEVLANENQLRQWQGLFHFDKNVYQGDIKKFLQNEPHLVVDTSLFPTQFQWKLLSLLSDKYDLDDSTDGVLIHADNFQALNLLQARYREQVKCIYIDPPYNTQNDGFIYKDGYPHSSWLSLMENRLLAAYSLLRQDGVNFISIDDNEQAQLKILCDEVYGASNFISSICHKSRASISNDKIISQNHNFLLFFSKDYLSIHCQRKMFGVIANLDGYNKVDKNGDKYKLTPVDGPGGASKGNPYYEFMGVSGYWRYSFETMNKLYEQGHLVVTKNNIQKKTYLKDMINKRQTVTTWWEEGFLTSNGTRDLDHILTNDFSNPKNINLIKQIVDISSNYINEPLTLDYFAGSGTTAHAVINLNRDDGGKRKYILVEQGEYFDTVLKPRVQKVIYSEKWKNGKPDADKDKGFNGVSQLVKVLKLESYEDTLNNLELKGQAKLFDSLSESAREDYLLRYMLAVESKGSLLNTDHFKNPFAYQLNIATDSAGAYRRQTIDLLETFHYLIGLRVAKWTDKREARGFVLVEGRLPNGESCLLVWRDGNKVSYQEVDKLFEQLNIQPNSNQYDVVYLNGDHNIATLWQSDDGSETRALKLRPIEPEFLRLMFGEEA